MEIAEKKTKGGGRIAQRMLIQQQLEMSNARSHILKSLKNNNPGMSEDEIRNALTKRLIRIRTSGR